jgi:hypothetical protein
MIPLDAMNCDYGNFPRTNAYLIKVENNSKHILSKGKKK